MLTASRLGEAPSPRRCAACGKTEVKLKLCTGCRSVRFCSRQCSVDFWPTHKRDCKRIARSKQVNKNKSYFAWCVFKVL